MKEEEFRFESIDGVELSGSFVPATDSQHYCLLAHGITGDKDEYGDFHRNICDNLYESGIGSIRFDFRGHGESDLAQRDVTVLGLLLDIKAAYLKLCDKTDISELSVLASSFGSPPSIFFTQQYSDKISNLILLNPVLDFEATFLRPIVPWARESFNDSGMDHLQEKGYLVLDGAFEIGAEMVEEFRYLSPTAVLSDFDTPILAIHGDEDTKVPHSITKQYGTPTSDSEFVTVPGAGHGFSDPSCDEASEANRDRVIMEVSEWLTGS